MKKSNLDPELWLIYRPAPNLRFMSKLVGRVAFEQTNLYLESNNLRSKNHRAFICSHSMEMVSLKVFNDLLCYVDESRSVMYIGLAFDIIDNQILIEMLAKRIGLQFVVLLFIKNFVLNRSQQVITNERFPGDIKSKTGVPQGSVLGPSLSSC